MAWSWKTDINVNPFMPNVFPHPYQLDESISNFRVIQFLKETSVSK